MLALFAFLIYKNNFSYTLPEISNHHWKRDPIGATLYDETGKESLSFIGVFGDSAQVCPFEKQSTLTCGYFETNEQALAWIVSLYK